MTFAYTSQERAVSIDLLGWGCRFGGVCYVHLQAGRLPRRQLFWGVFREVQRLPVTVEDFCATFSDHLRVCWFQTAVKPRRSPANAKNVTISSYVLRAEEPFYFTNRHPQRVAGRRHGRSARCAEGSTSAQEAHFAHIFASAATFLWRGPAIFRIISPLFRAARHAGPEEPSSRGDKSLEIK